MAPSSSNKAQPHSKPSHATLAHVLPRQKHLAAGTSHSTTSRRGQGLTSTRQQIIQRATAQNRSRWGLPLLVRDVAGVQFLDAAAALDGVKRHLRRGGCTVAGAQTTGSPGPHVRWPRVSPPWPPPSRSCRTYSPPSKPPHSHSWQAVGNQQLGCAGHTYPALFCFPRSCSLKTSYSYPVSVTLAACAATRQRDNEQHSLDTANPPSRHGQHVGLRATAPSLHTGPTHFIQRPRQRHNEQRVGLCAKAHDGAHALVMREPELRERPLAAKVLGQRNRGDKALQGEGGEEVRAGACWRVCACGCARMSVSIK